MSKQTLGFIMTWTNNTQDAVTITGLYGDGNLNWNDTNGSGEATLNQEYTLQPGQSLTVTSNVEDCKDFGFQYVSLIANNELFAQTYLQSTPNSDGVMSSIVTVDASAQTGDAYSNVNVQINMNDKSYNYPWGSALCYLNTIATGDIDGTCIGGFASGNNADANMTLNGYVVINGLTPEEVEVTSLIANYPS